MIAEKRRNVLAGCAVLICVGLLGCASMTPLEPPEVTLVNLEAGDVTVFETTLTAQIRITNTNPEPLVIEGAAFKLYLEDVKVGTGVTSEVFTVERLDSYVVSTTFHLNNAVALLRLATILEQKQIHYAVKTTVYSPGTFGSRKLKTVHDGTLDLGGGGAEPTTPTNDL